MDRMTDMESLLKSALAPVEPSEALGERLERGLSQITDAAAGELADWELSAMRDPRAWGRLIAAVVIGGAAAGALAIVRTRRHGRRRPVVPTGRRLRALPKRSRAKRSFQDMRALRRSRRYPLDVEAAIKRIRGAARDIARRTRR